MDLPSFQSSLYLIDAIGPFFPGYDRFRINWSKLPWIRFEAMDAEELEATFAQVRGDMQIFCQSVAAIGYTGVTLDDVPHLAEHEFYEEGTRERIHLYREHFRDLFRIIRAEGLHVYLTMDILTFTPALEEKIGKNAKKQREFLVELLDSFLEDFPEVAGVVVRIGESDGLDIKEQFRSKLVLKSPAMVNKCLQSILPVFEKHGRRCIFRTWTVGAHSVGDLIWHHATLEKTVAGISSPALVLSMKYGESDFFRYLSLNRNFFVTDLPKIVELQTRREYEGCGEYPSFVGHDYEQLAIELRHAPNVIGISVWCQTGGWTPFRRLAFLGSAGDQDLGNQDSSDQISVDPDTDDLDTDDRDTDNRGSDDRHSDDRHSDDRHSAIWTEINTFVTLRLFKHGELVEEAISHLPGVSNLPALQELLRLSEEVVVELLYLPDFARRRLYFRRVRIPPLIGVYWHHIFVAHSLKKMLNHFVEEGETSIRAGHAAMTKIKRMRSLALECNLPEEDIEYMEYTFGIIALAREYFFRPYDEEIRKRLKTAKKNYKRRYPKGTRYRYTVRLDFEPFRLNRRYIGFFAKYLLRRTPRYRFIDRILGLRLLSVAYFVLKRSRPKLMPKIARKSAMGIDAVFK